MLVVSFLVLSAFFLIHTNIVNTHERFQWNPNYFRKMQYSSFAGTIIFHALIIYYFTKVQWYQALFVFALCMVLPRMIVPMLSAQGAGLRVTFFALVSFIAWPAAAFWTYFQIASIPG